MKRTSKERRPGYAPDNPAVGRRGQRTRDKIVGEARQLFAENGVHGTSIDAIAKAIGGSRATVYQYFQSKEEILSELLDECEPALIEHARRLRLLGPTPDGLRELQVWLTDLTGLYDRYTVAFVEFPGIGLHQGVPVARAHDLSEAYLDAIAGEVRRVGIQGLDAEDAATALLRIAHMVNLYRSRHMFDLESDEAVAQSLAVAMQCMLFPEAVAQEPATGVPQPISATEHASLPAEWPDVDRDNGPDFGSASPVRLDVLSAASTLFADHGYHGVSMEDIAIAADISRASLYRYFNTKTAVLSELTDWAVMEGRVLSVELHRLAFGGLGPSELRAWLSRYVRYHRNYGSVIRAWYDGTVAQQLPEDAVGQGLGPFHAAVHAVLAGVDLPIGMESRVAEAIFLAALGRLSEMAVSRHPNLSDYDAAELVYTVLQRALLGRAAAFREA